MEDSESKSPREKKKSHLRNWWLFGSFVVALAIVIAFTWTTDFSRFWQPLIWGGISIFIGFTGYFETFIKAASCTIVKISGERPAWWFEKWEGRMNTAVFRWLARAVVIGIFFYCPYRAHRIEVKEKNALIESHTLEKLELRYWREAYKRYSDDPKDRFKHRAFSNYAFELGEYSNAIVFANLSFKDRPAGAIANYNESQIEPYLYAAELRVELGKAGRDSTQIGTACSKFENSLKGMTNRMDEAVANKTPLDAYNTRSMLQLNMVALNSLFRVIPSAESNFLSQIVQTVSALEQKATYP